MLVTVEDLREGTREVRMAGYIEDDGWMIDHGDEGDYVVLSWMRLPDPDDRAF